MTPIIFTKNIYHLGDNLIFLHLLRALAKQCDRKFVHFCHAHLIPQLQEAFADLPNISLKPLESPLWDEHRRDATDTWKNAEQHWELSPTRWDWSTHQLRHHAWIANKMGFESPFTCREHLLFDYPALDVGTRISAKMPSLEHDFLIVNSRPCSGQLMCYDTTAYLDPLIEALSKKHRVLVTQPTSIPFITCTQDAGLTISDIGGLSVLCQNIIGVATGPLWPCMNTTNNHYHEGRRFIALLGNGEALNMPRWEQAPNVEAVWGIARKEGWV